MVFKKKMIAAAAVFACILQSAAATGNAADSMKYEAEDAKITGTLERMYKFTEQGSANADCSGKNDGVTNGDALAIQKFMLRLIDKLPEA